MSPGKKMLRAPFIEIRYESRFVFLVFFMIDVLHSFFSSLLKFPRFISTSIIDVRYDILYVLHEAAECGAWFSSLTCPGPPPGISGVLQAHWQSATGTSCPHVDGHCRWSTLQRYFIIGWIKGGENKTHKKKIYIWAGMIESITPKVLGWSLDASGGLRVKGRWVRNERRGWS